MKSFNLVFGMLGFLMVLGLFHGGKVEASGMFIPPRPNAVKPASASPNPPCEPKDEREVCKGQKDKEKGGDSGASGKK